MATIVFIGLGNMGAPIAGHLANAGNTLYVSNRSRQKVDQWLEHNPGTALQGTTLPADTDAVILCVSRDDDVKEWLIDNGIIDQLKPGSVIIDHSTTSATLAENMAEECKKGDIFFCDIPVSGGQQGAQSGQLSLMAGADSAIFDYICSITAPYTKAIAHMGPPGNGQKTKMVNQICVAGLIQALAEGVHFAENNGLDVEKVMQLIGAGAASSWQLVNRHKTMIEGRYDHGFAVSLMHKDLQICLNQASESNTSLPVTRLVDGYYSELET
ncbi:MAG: NAD(P)-dependent oxidoreductase, partial [Thalassolituus sp.]